MDERQKRQAGPEIGAINGRRWVVAPELQQPRRRKIVSRRTRAETRGAARQTIDDGVPRGNRRWFLQTAGAGALGLLVAHAAGLFGNKETKTPTLPAPATAPPKPIHIKLPAPTFNAEVVTNEEIQTEVDGFLAQFNNQPEAENLNLEPVNPPVEPIDIKDISFAPAENPKITFEASGGNQITFSREESLAKQIKFVRQQPPILIPSKPASLIPEVTVVVATESQKHQASFFTAIAEANVNGIQNEAGWIAEHDPLSVSGIQRELERAVTILAPVDTTGLVNSLALGHNSFPETDVAKAEAIWFEAQRNQQANFEHLTRQEQMLKIAIESATKTGQFQHLTDPNIIAAPEGTLIIPEDPAAIPNSGSGGAGWLPGFPFFVFSVREATNTLVALAQSQIELQPFDSYDAAYRVKKANPLSDLVPSQLADAMYDNKVFKPIIKALGKLDFVEVEQFEGSLMKDIGGTIWQINRGGRFQVGQTFRIRSVAEIIRDLLN